MWILIMAAICALIIFSLGLSSMSPSGLSRERHRELERTVRAHEAITAALAASEAAGKPTSPADMAAHGDAQADYQKSDRNKLVASGQ
jgi:hypothetical protein